VHVPVQESRDKIGYEMTKKIVIIGAGPAGLTAGVEALRKGYEVEILEATFNIGGISQTVQVDGWRFDLGGHRFFTKVKRVEDFWKSILKPNDFLQRPRQSRIFYKGKFFEYPLKPANALFGLGIIETIRCVVSYFIAQIKRNQDQTNFEGWVSKRFGWRLYSIFFKTYTEKVWGMPATELSSAWAAQRIKNLSLLKAVTNAFGFHSKKDGVITTLIDTFEYPRLGPGMMWEAAADLIVSKGGKVSLREIPKRIYRVENSVAVESNNKILTADVVISSLPLSELPHLLGCKDLSIIKSAENLKYRDFLTVGLIVEGENHFTDNWIYIHSPEVKVGRIQNFRSWSPDLVKPGYTFLGLEYFVNRGDEYWTQTDEALIDLGTREIVQLGLVSESEIAGGYVVRVPKAYPVYDDEYQNSVETIANWLKEYWPEVIPVGRNGMHRYNNQDHSMLTAMLAIDNIDGDQKHDLWSVNVEAEYHEESAKKDGSGGRSAPVFSNTKKA
jgi:protoporphyrinogen oxidase